MKRHLFQSISFLCLIAAFSLTSCSKIEDTPDNTPEIQQPAAITFTATLAPKGEGPQSKAITTGEKDGKEILNVAWASGERISIYYQTANGYAKTEAVVKAVNNGVATIEATLTGAIDGGTAKFVYPYSLATDNGELNIDTKGTSSAFRKQDGTIEYISENLDAATSTVTIAVTGSTATVSGTVTMQNQVCICKFNFSGLSTDETENYYTITIREKQGNSTMNTYYAPNIAKASMDAVYMALLGADGKDFTFSLQGNHNDQNGTMKKNSYVTSSTNVTLEAGKFYRSIPVAMGLEPISSQKNSTVFVPDRGILTLDVAKFNVANGPAIQCEGDATIILTGTNEVKTSDSGQPAIFIPEGKTLTIQGTGSLTASGGGGGAGIGSGKAGTCGDITISGGTVTASGGGGGAGIGSGAEGTCGDITISGGTVTASGGIWAAGIGSGAGSKYGTISIGKGITSVTATSGGSEAAPIGKGQADQGSGTVTIDGKDTTTWTAGEDTDHLHWTVSNDGKTWTLTKKPESNQQ